MTQLSAANLRALIDSTQWPEMVISKSEALLFADAIEIADSCARADIECNVEPAFPDGGSVPWYDLDHVDAESAAPVAQAVRYLEARGLLDRRPSNPQHVRPHSPK